MNQDQSAAWPTRVLTIPPPALPSGHLHLYAMRCDVEGDLGTLQAFLAPEELQRARAFVHARDQRRFVLARAVLRYLLGQYVGVHPSAVAFRYGVMGKPSLDPLACGHGMGVPGCHFNVSHSGEWVLYAFSVSAACGVDVEKIRQRNNNLKIAQRFFHGTESAYLQSLAAPQQCHAFYRMWVLKEAYAKALGQSVFELLATPVGAPGHDDHNIITSSDGQQLSASYLNICCGYAVAWCVATVSPVLTHGWILEDVLTTEKV